MTTTRHDHHPEPRAASAAPTPATGCVVYWFRRDLRLDDNPGLLRAQAMATQQGLPLQPVCVALPSLVRSPRGKLQRAQRVQTWVQQAQADLACSLQALDSGLLRCADVDALIAWAHSARAVAIFAEHIELPYELKEQEKLTQAGPWHTEFVWQSGLFEAEQLPFSIDRLPAVFTAFRQKIENAGLRSAAPLGAPLSLAPLPAAMPSPQTQNGAAQVTPVEAHLAGSPHDARSSIVASRQGGATAAMAHWMQFLSQQLPHRYFETRNGLHGADFSTQLSVDLAWGALSVRRVVQRLDAFEAEHGSSKSSYWIWFELMWREHFRWLSYAHGARLFHACGLASQPRACTASAADWQRWCEGQTGHDLIDAGMRELRSTGFLSNRMRQIVASYWLHDMGGDWRAGAAWFESQLLDEDPYSNTGNWLYIAGLGTDPRGGRRFDPDKQARDHDPQGGYRRLWA